jgi:chaperonin GroES
MRKRVMRKRGRVQAAGASGPTPGRRLATEQKANPRRERAAKAEVSERSASERAAPLSRTKPNKKEVIPMPNIKPLRDRILVKRVEESEQRVGGIIVPDSAKEKPQRAEVIAIGSGRLLENGERVALVVKPGNQVLIGKWSGTEVKIDGEEYLILKEDDVLGVIE